MLNFGITQFPGLGKYSSIGSRLATQQRQAEQNTQGNYLNPTLQPAKPPVSPLLAPQETNPQNTITSTPMVSGPESQKLPPMQAGEAPQPAQEPQAPTNPSPPAMSQLRDVTKAHSNLINIIANLHRKYQAL